MRPCTAVGVLFLIYQLLDVSALYDDSEVNKREAGRLYYLISFCYRFSEMETRFKFYYESEFSWFL